MVEAPAAAAQSVPGLACWLALIGGTVEETEDGAAVTALRAAVVLVPAGKQTEAWAAVVAVFMSLVWVVAVEREVKAGVQHEVEVVHLKLVVSHCW